MAQAAFIQVHPPVPRFCFEFPRSRLRNGLTRVCNNANPWTCGGRFFSLMLLDFTCRPDFLKWIDANG